MKPFIYVDDSRAKAGIARLKLNANALWKKSLRLNSTLCCIPCVVAKATHELHEELGYVRNADHVLLVKLPMEKEISCKPKFTSVTHVLSSTRQEMKVKVEKGKAQSFPCPGADKSSRDRNT